MAMEKNKIYVFKSNGAQAATRANCNVVLELELILFIASFKTEV